MRFLAPPAVTSTRIGRLPGPTQAPSPFDLLQVLEGLLLACPAALFHAAAAPGVSPLQSFSLARNSARLVTWRSLLDVVSGPPQRPGRVPKGFGMPSVRSRRRSISSEAEPMLSWVFYRFNGFPKLPVGTLSRGLIRSWPSFRFPSRSLPRRAFSVFVPEVLGSRSRGCQPSAFFAFSTADESGWRVGSIAQSLFRVY
jgi:hypothetical protein